jgi:hypothetical protein
MRLDQGPLWGGLGTLPDEPPVDGECRQHRTFDEDVADLKTRAKRVRDYLEQRKEKAR